MAETLTQKNPRLVRSDNPMEKQYVLVGNSATFKMGQPGYFNAGLAVVVADDGTTVHFVFLETRDTAETATYAWVGLVTDDMVFEGFEYNGVLAASNIGITYACEVTSNIFTVDVDDQGANDIVKVVDLASNYEPSRNKITDIKARLTFKYLTASIDA